MIDKDFEIFEKLDNPEFPFASKVGYKDCVFYVEPQFFAQLQGMKAYRADVWDIFWNGFLNTILENKKVVFTQDYENTYVNIDGFIYREITDISDPLHIFVEDKSRGSDYGD